MFWRCFTCAALLIGGVCHAREGVPYTPARDDIVLQNVPSRADPRVRRFDALRSDLRRDPEDMQRAVKLARAYVDYGRDTGDARYLGRADAVIASWTTHQPVPIPVLLIQATVLQSKHYFSAARAMLLDVLKRDRDNDQAWLTLATVAQVQGDLAGARSACSHLLGSSNPLVPGGCLTSLSAVSGHAAEAYRTLELLLPQTRAAPIAVQAWFRGIMADTAMYLGDADAADGHFRAALQLAPGDNFLLADYADFLLDHKRPAAALNLVKPYATSDTSFLRQVFAEIALDAPQAAADTHEMARRWAAIDQRGTRAYRREEAMFVLHARHDAPRALALARENWEVQRAPKDARILLEAALAAGHPEAAAPVTQYLDRSHLEDPIVVALAARVRAASPSSPAVNVKPPAVSPVDATPRDQTGHGASS